MLYDDFSSEGFVDPDSKETFRAFLDGDGKLGAARHRVMVPPPSFTCILASKEWPAPDESSLRRSFWACSEFSDKKTKEKLEALLPEELRPGVQKLFSARLSAMKPLYQSVGDLPIVRA